MLLRHRLAAALVSAVLLTLAAHAAEIDRTLQVSAAPDLYVSNNSGRIHIYPGAGNQIHITAHVHASFNSGGDIETRIRRIAANPPIRQSGNAIHIGDAPDRTLYNDITIDYDISAPAAVALNLRTGSGDIEVDNLGRFLKADSGSGSVRAHGLNGTADLTSGSGDIELQQHAQAEVRAVTGSGSIRIQGLDGALQARTGSGDIEASGQIIGQSRLETGSGSIRLHLGSSAHINLDASTGSGSIRFPGFSGSDETHVSQPINGGGPSVNVQTGSGDIEIN